MLGMLAGAAGGGAGGGMSASSSATATNGDFSGGAGGYSVGNMNFGQKSQTQTTVIIVALIGIAAVALWKK